MNSRRALFSAGPCLWLLAGLLLSAGCARHDAASASSADGPPNGTAEPRRILRVGNGAEPQDLDPQTVTGIPEFRIIVGGLFEGLVDADPRDLHPIPGLAESWSISPDGLVYTFHLRANLRWSNGDPIVADDFIQSYRRILNPAFAADYAYLIFNFVRGAEEYYRGKSSDFSTVGFKAVDERTLQVTLKDPTPFLLKIIACHYAWEAVPTKVIAKFGPLDRKDTGWTRAGNLVGSGPFILKSWVPNQKIVLARNPQYWDAANVKMDEIEFYPTEDLATEERMFRGGQLDATNDLPRGKIDAYRHDHPEELRIDPWLGIYFYRYNVTRAPLNDVRVRRALALAVDREKLTRDVMRGGEIPAYAVSYPGNSGYTPRAHLTGGIAEAQRLLAEAGYPGGKGFPPVEVLYNTYESHRQIAEAIQAMWRQNLGIEVTLVNQEWKVYLDTQHATHNFQIERAGWIADYADPNVFLELWETNNGNNDTLWSSAEYDRLLHAALRAKTEAERYENYQKMDEILVHECPVLPLYYYTRVYALSPRVKGWWPNLIDYHPWKYVYLEN
jgi:oligopeptide transport system substrate-binding protein